MSDPCPPGQRNDVVLISPNSGGTSLNSIAPHSTINVSPPCGCYESMGVSVLDVVAVGWIMKSIGRFPDLIKYLIKVAKESNTKWTRCVSLLGGKLTDFATEFTESLIAKSSTSVFLRFKKVIPDSIDNLLTKHADDFSGNYLKPLNNSAIEPALDNVTHTEVGSILRRRNSPNDIIHYKDSVPSAMYATTRIKNAIDIVLTKVDSQLEALIKLRADKKTIRGFLSRFTNNEGTFPVTNNTFRRFIPFKVEISTPDKNTVEVFEININDFLPSFDLSSEEFRNIVLQTQFVKDGFYKGTAKAIRKDRAWIDANVYKANQEGGIWARIRDLLASQDPAITPIQTDLDNITEMNLYTIGEALSVMASSQKNSIIKKINIAEKNAIPKIEKELYNLQVAEANYIDEVQHLTDVVSKTKNQWDEDIAIQADKDGQLSLLLPQVSWAGAVVFHVLGKAIGGLYRDKVCLGDAIGGFWGSEDGARLNHNNCNCECPGNQSECTADYALNPVWGKIAWTWDNILPVTPKTSEMVTCYETCCDSQTAWKSTLTQRCGCSCFGDIPSWAVPLGSGSSESHFKASEDCPCTKPGWFLGFGTTTGACVTDTQTTTALGQGQAWDEAKCEYNCAETRALPEKLGASPDCPDTKLTTNMSGSSYSTFKIGSACECACSQAAYNHYNDPDQGTWPPTCPAGYVFDTRANVCGCMPAGVCKEYLGDPTGETFSGPNRLANAIQFINDNTANCTSPYVHGYYYSSGPSDIVAEVVGRYPVLNEEGDQIGYEVVTAYTSEGDCGATFVRTDVCKVPEITHNYTWTACPTDGSSCPLTLSDEAFNYTYP